MKADITIDGKTATLTSEHAVCSYGQVVLLLDGQAYGPCDYIGEDQAGAIVNSIRMQWPDFGDSDAPDRLLARRFVHQGIRMPQCDAPGSIPEILNRMLGEGARG